ncbi:hypothetical protein SAMN05443247_07068 [Bradyrhizobium erythrophlei]|nr:hypothetical protein SAMN05443247_07068 [Bradyrhizobium erythrophlei]
MAAERGWQREFDDPIPLPSSGQMKTLEDAARFIQKLPKAEQQRAHWQLAVETLINCAEGRDLLFHARVAVLRALHHDEPDPAATPRRKQTKRYKVVR